MYTHRVNPRSFAVILLMLVALVTASCASGALRSVHDTYLNEFQASLTRENDGSEAAKALDPSNRNQFPETLTAISSFRSEYPNSTNAIKHVSVLEAMVYLQSGQYGLARLAAKNAKGMPGDLSTYKDGLIRDQLFLLALTDERGRGLIDVWEMIESTRGFPSLEKANTFEDLGDNLSDLAKRSKAPAHDEGKTYIAAVAVLCYQWAMEGKKLAVVGTPAEKQRHIKEIETKYGNLMKDALEPHLTDVEKNATDAELQELARWSARYRYVRLYHVGKKLAP